MNVDELKAAKTKLALALAQGVSITAWARARSMARSTVYRWAKGCLTIHPRCVRLKEAFAKYCRQRPGATGLIFRLMDIWRKI